MNHYLQRYNKIITHYKNTITEGYVEKHHIQPKCMGGTDDIDNLVALPPRAHIICHYLLHKAYPEHLSLARAFAMMSVNNKHQHRPISSRLYEKGRIARANAMKGFKHSEETLQKMRKPKQSKENYAGPKSKEHAEAISKSLRGKKKSKKHIQKLSESLRPYHDKRKREHKLKKQKIQKEFLESGMTRKQFAKHINMKYNTLKKYLTNL